MGQMTINKILPYEIKTEFIDVDAIAVVKHDAVVPEEPVLEYVLMTELKPIINNMLKENTLKLKRAIELRNDINANRNIKTEENFQMILEAPRLNEEYQEFTQKVNSAKDLSSSPQVTKITLKLVLLYIEAIRRVISELDNLKSNRPANLWSLNKNNSAYEQNICETFEQILEHQKKENKSIGDMAQLIGWLMEKTGHTKKSALAKMLGWSSSKLHGKFRVNCFAPEEIISIMGIFGLDLNLLHLVNSFEYIKAKNNKGDEPDGD